MIPGADVYLVLAAVAGVVVVVVGGLRELGRRQR